jgi:hypothetical protein
MSEGKINKGIYFKKGGGEREKRKIYKSYNKNTRRARFIISAVTVLFHNFNSFSSFSLGT